MESDLDPYHEFLGIPPQEQPPNHYRLLGVPLFESDEKVLNSQYDMRRNHLRTLFATEFANVAQRLMDEVAHAISVLRDPARRLAYDGSLRVPVASGGAVVPDRVWLVGSKEDCDIVVRDQKVSRLHCRLTFQNGEYYLQDTGSRNGTFVNGARVMERVKVSSADVVTLGLSVRLPWPAPAHAAHSRAVTIGRAPDNNFVLDDDSVSAHHAVARWQGGELILEDLNSKNGTAVGSRENRIASRRISQTDRLFFGAAELPAERLWNIRGSTGADA